MLRALFGRAVRVGCDNAAMHLQILDLDGAALGQTSLATVAPWTSVSTLPLRDLAARLRLWGRNRTMREARARIHASAHAEPTLSLLGSGDFHHLAVLLMEQAREPFTIVHIDNHPDWVRLAPRWHCGSWVNQALRLPNVDKVMTLGPCSEDLVRPDLKGGNLPALATGRIILFPWQHAPSRVWRRIPDGPGHRYEQGRIIWSNLAEIGVEKALDAIIPLIRTKAVWFSIDKDVLSEADALTNWDQGQMPLAAVVQIIAAVGACKRIVGADICGEFSVAAHPNWLKRWEARIDQPQRVAAPDLLVRNEATNKELLVAIELAATPR
jgi:arginase family enzyme